MKLNLFSLNRIVAVSLGLALLPVGLRAFPAPQWMQGGHSARVTGVVCSPDGTMIASSSEDGTIKIWSANGALLKTLDTQPYPATAVAWSPDGTKIAAGTYYGAYSSSKPGLGLTYLWQATGGWTNSAKLVRVSTNFFGKVTSLAFNANSTRLAWGHAAGSNTVASVSSGSVLANYPAYDLSQTRPAAATSVAISSAGLIASGCEDSTIAIYDMSWGSSIWSSTGTANAHTTNVTAVAFSPNGSYLASASLDQTIKIWSTSGTLQQTLTGHSAGVVSVAFSPDSQKLVTGSVDGTLKIWNWSSGTCLVTIPAHALPVTAAVFTPDGTRVVSGSDDSTVRVWSAADGSALYPLGQRDYIGAIAFSPDGTLCASAGGDATIQVRNTADGSLVRTLPGHTGFVSSLAFSPDSATLASGGGPLDPTIKLWPINNPASVQTIPATTNGVMALAWSPDGSTLACGGDSVEQNITFWSPNGTLQGTLPGTLTGHTNGVTALAFSAQGNLLASGGRRPGNAVRVWTNSTGGIWTTGVLVQSFISTGTNNNVESVTFSPDGKYVAWSRSGQNVIKVGSVATGDNPTLGSTTNPVSSVAFAADGTTLAATDQNTITIWTNNGSSWSLYDTITNETVRPTRLAYSPNGNLLLCGREDGTLTLTPNTRGALGQPQLTFTSVKADPTGAAKISAAVQPLARYILMSSTNLEDWEYLTTATSPSNTLTLPNLTTTNAPATYYRALTPQ